MKRKSLGLGSGLLSQTGDIGMIFIVVFKRTFVFADALRFAVSAVAIKRRQEMRWSSRAP